MVSAASAAAHVRPSDPKDQPLLNLTWDYDFDEQPRLPDARSAALKGNRTLRIKRDVIEDRVPCQTAFGVALKRMRELLVAVRIVVEHPGCEAKR